MGLINQLLGLDVKWYLDSDLALFCVAMVVNWNLIAMDFIFLARRMRAVPASYYESASLDGADGWKVFWNITLPSISPTVFFLPVSQHPAGVSGLWAHQHHDGRRAVRRHGRAVLFHLPGCVCQLPVQPGGRKIGFAVPYSAGRHGVSDEEREKEGVLPRGEHFACVSNSCGKTGCACCWWLCWPRFTSFRWCAFSA